MKYLASIVTMLTSAWLAAGLVIVGNFTPTDAPVSVLPHIEPKIDGSITWTSTPATFQRMCAAPTVSSTVRSGLDINKADCNVLMSYFVAQNGYWTLKDYSNCASDCGLLSYHGTCAIAAARTDGSQSTVFYVGNRDVSVWLNKARDSYTDHDKMGKTVGLDQCKTTPSGFANACFKVYKK